MKFCIRLEVLILAKILLLNSGLKHTQTFMKPFLSRLEVYLDDRCDCLDVRYVSTFDERTFFQYDQVIFLFFIALDSIPSSTLEIFERLESQPKGLTEIYALIACDEYEPEKCDISEKILQNWCQREQLHYKGSLKIGSALFIMKTISRFVVSNEMKRLSDAIIHHQDFYSKTTMLTDRIFMKKANQYWNKEVKKMNKLKRKRQKR